MKISRSYLALTIIMMVISLPGIGQNKTTTLDVFGSLGLMNFSNSFISKRQNFTANEYINDGQFAGDFAPPLSFVRTIGIGINPFKNKTWHINLSYWSGWIQEISVYRYEGEMNNYFFKFQENIFFQSGSLGLSKDFLMNTSRGKLSVGLNLNVLTGQDFSLYSASITPNQGVDRIKDTYDASYDYLRVFSEMFYYIHPEIQVQYAYSVKSYFELFAGVNYLFKEILPAPPIPRNNFNGFGMQIGMRTRISLAKEGN